MEMTNINPNLPDVLTKMEFTVQEYKRSVGKVLTTSDGHNYVYSKITQDYIYLKCALFRSGCKGTSKLNRSRNVITQMNLHNHSVEEYKTEVDPLKTRCKTLAKYSQTNLREVFDDTTRNDPYAADISFVKCELSMYRARRTLQPKIPFTATEFCDMLVTSTFKDYYKFSVTQGGQTAVIFYSDEMINFSVRRRTSSLMVPFRLSPFSLFNYGPYLWLLVDIRSMQSTALMTSKSQELYSAILKDLVNFQQIASMSDWERATRNAFKEFNTQMKVYMGAGSASLNVSGRKLRNLD